MLQTPMASGLAESGVDIQVVGADIDRTSGLYRTFTFFQGA